jgi:SAM-dependent methyltransferase
LLNHLRRHFDARGVELSDWARSAAIARANVPVHSTISELEDASISGIVSVHVVEHIEEVPLKATLAEWYRVLKPGGRALVITPDAGGFAARCKGDAWVALTDPTHINLKAHRDWVMLFEAAGFRHVVGFADGLWDFPYQLKSLGKAEVFLLGWPTLAQFLLARPLIPAGSGESSIIVAEKPA